MVASIFPTFSYSTAKELMAKIFDGSVQAGFPSPADDYLEKAIDLNELLIKKPAATFIVKAKGESMIGAGIFDGSYLVVDRSLSITNNSICVARVDGEFTVKRYLNFGVYIELRPENSKYKSIIVSEDNDFEIWGIVRSVITEFR